MSITASLLQFFTSVPEDGRKQIAHAVKRAAQEFIASPAYAVLLKEAAIGAVPEEGEEAAYIAMQRQIYRLNEMAALDTAAVMRQTVRVNDGQYHGLDRA